MNRAARATIDSAALRANLGAVRASAPRTRVMAVIKANAYGHGIVPVARALSAADAFAVARLEEALQIREAGLAHRIILLEGIFHPEQLDLASSLQLELVVHCPEQIQMLEQSHGRNPFPVWLKIDTGMNRLGIAESDVPDFRKRLEACDAVVKPLHYMTHLACADETSNAMTTDQMSDFSRIMEGIEGERSIANSAGVLAWPDSHADWVRPGIMLYGVSPFQGLSGKDLGLRPAMSLSSELIAVKTISRGATVGYGAMWTAEKEIRLGIAAIGYGDGYTRHLGNGTPVIVAGRKAALAGRISMDLIAIDLRDVPEARVGDEVVLWGDQLPVESLAQAAGTIPYELLCGVTQRVAMQVS